MRVMSPVALLLALCWLGAAAAQECTQVPARPPPPVLRPDLFSLLPLLSRLCYSVHWHGPRTTHMCMPCRLDAALRNHMLLANPSCRRCLMRWSSHLLTPVQLTLWPSRRRSAASCARMRPGQAPPSR